MRSGPAALARRDLLVVAAVALPALAISAAAHADGPRFETLEAAVVGVRSEVPGDARTAETLGTTRVGSAVLIDGQGLALTVGWLVMEATSIELLDRSGKVVPADLVGWDAESGLGLVRASVPLDGKPLRLGSANGLERGAPVLALSRIGPLAAQPQMVAARREFAGYWEYLLDDAVFTTPAFESFAGAALIDREGSLVGIGLLAVGDAVRPGMATPGNMFVPIDAILPALGDLIATGRRDGPSRGWLGVTAVEDGTGVRVVRVAPDSPAASAGIAEGDLIRRVAGTEVGDLADCWRALRAAGPAGTTVAIDLQRAGATRSITATTVDRSSWLRLRPTF